jgi:antagonist of KipI
MSLTIIKAGIQDSIQDMGRYGHQHLGINPSGAMDKYAMQIGNILVGNNPTEAVLEMHFPASVFLFKKQLMIAITGADFSPSINGEMIPSGHALIVNKNDVLQFHRPVAGARAYLAVKGGYAVPAWLNSRSTNMKAAAGGFQGRSLQKNDELPVNIPFQSKKQPNSFAILPWKADNDFMPVKKEPNGSMEVFVLPGQEWERLATESKENFEMTSFVITQQSDRMGYRLDNIPFPVLSREELVSSPVCSGTIQLLPDGKLIILMADHQTTGGYPRIAYVITAHRSRLAQLKAGERVFFKMTDQATAEDLLMKQEFHLQQLRDACTFRLEEYLHETGY